MFHHSVLAVSPKIGFPKAAPSTRSTLLGWCREYPPQSINTRLSGMFLFLQIGQNAQSQQGQKGRIFAQLWTFVGAHLLATRPNSHRPSVDCATCKNVLHRRRPMSNDRHRDLWQYHGKAPRGRAGAAFRNFRIAASTAETRVSAQVWQSGAGLPARLKCAHQR